MTSRAAFFSFLLLTFTVPSLAHAQSCSGESAVYRMADADGFELKLAPAKVKTAWSNLDAVLNTPQKSMTFSFTASNGYSFNYLVLHGSEDKDELSFHAYFFDDKMKTAGLPQSKQPAPKYLFTPELGSHLWYGDVENREFLPVEFWILQGC